MSAWRMAGDLPATLAASFASLDTVFALQGEFQDAHVEGCLVEIDVDVVVVK